MNESSRGNPALPLGRDEPPARRSIQIGEFKIALRGKEVSEG